MEVRYEEVRLLEAQSKYTEAIGLLKGLVDETVRPKYSAAESAARGQLLEELASLYRSNEQYTESVDAYRKATALNKENSLDNSKQIIDTYRAAKNTDGVRKEVDAAAAELRAQMKGKADVPALLMLASVYEKGKFFADEAKVLDEAGKVAANAKEKEKVYFMRGAMFERQKKVEPAEAEFRKVLASNPEDYSTLNYLGYMLVDHKLRVEEATQMIRKALDGDPENGAYLERIGPDPTVHDHLVDVYFKLGKIKEAITQWQSSLKDFRSPAGLDSEPEDVAKVTRKLDAARVKFAKESK